ncbi:MAG: hypothetical protein JSS20_13210, partial [Proteobacteria bacterium]|nr:hypothetical protein [Pseudomonadota bacterium]
MLELFGNFDPSSIMRSLHDWAPTLGTVIAAMTATIMVSQLLGRRKGDRPGLASRAGSVIWNAFTTNWQLTLLSTTALVLSLASGWTTWDGMRNFTGEPVLSLMVTFGIQGVMLIIAWLIGESFASGMGRSQSHKRVEWNFGAIVGALVFVGLSAMVLRSVGAFDGLMTNRSHSWIEFADKSLYVGVALLVIVALIANHRSTILHPYVDSMRVMARNAILWVMFLSCMATSVFFSFDSLFSAIFPKDERRRAADIRAARQVAGAVADIGALAGRRQAEESEQLFATKGWGTFEQNLTALAKASQGAEQDIERFFVEKREAVNRSVASQQERIATAKSGQAGLASRKGVLTDELSRLKGERPGLAADLAEKKTELDNRQKGLDAKRVEMMAEERGAEGTLKVGQGPVYRQRKGELQQLQDAAKIQEERVRDADKRLGVTDTRIAQINRELAAIDGDLAKLKGEAETAEQRIQITEQSRAGDEEGQKVDPARVRLSFERALADFRQGPTAERLDRLAGQCSQLLNAMAATPAT